MSVEFRMDRDEGIVYGTCRGEVTAEEIMEHLAGVFMSEDYEPWFRGLTDLRETSWESNQGDLRKLVQFLIRHRDRIGKHRSAVVVANERAYGMARMFEVFSEQTPINVRVFRDYDKAKSWILEKEDGEE